MFKTTAVLALVISSGQVLSDCGPGETRLTSGACGVDLGTIGIIASPWNIPNYQDWDNRDRLGDNYDWDPEGAGGGGGGGGDGNSQDPDEEDSNDLICTESETRQTIRTYEEEYAYLNSAGFAPEIGGGLAGLAVGGWVFSTGIGSGWSGVITVAVAAFVTNWLEDVMGPQHQVRCGSTIIQNFTVCFDNNYMNMLSEEIQSGNIGLGGGGVTGSGGALLGMMQNHITTAVDTRIIHNRDQCKSDISFPPIGGGGAHSSH